METSKIEFKGDHQEFIREIFSEDYIRQSRELTLNYVSDFLKKVSIASDNGDFIVATDLFERLNHSGGYRNGHLDLELYEILKELGYTHQLILAMLVTRFYNLYDISKVMDADYLTDEEIAKNIEYILLKEYSALPDFISDKLISTAYCFATEFDCSLGQISKETFDETLQHYISVDNFFAN